VFAKAKLGRTRCGEQSPLARSGASLDALQAGEKKAWFKKKR